MLLESFLLEDLQSKVTITILRNLHCEIPFTPFEK